MPQVKVHRAFRDVGLVDTTDAQREAEEARRVARRKKRSGNKQHKKRKGLDNSNPAMIRGSSNAFPPLKLDAASQLGVISLSRSTPTLLPSATMTADLFVRQTSVQIALPAPPQSKDTDTNHAKRRTTQDGPQIDSRHHHYTQEQGNDTAGAFDEQGSMSSPKKGLLSPSHQGRFAACGNLVPMSTVLWQNAHGGVSGFRVGVGVGGDNGGMGKEDDDVDRQIAAFQREYDKAHAEEDAILADWINKSTLEDVPAGEAPRVEDGGGGGGGGGGGSGGGFSIGFGVASIEMSTSMSVVKNISLTPLPPRTPTTAGSVRSMSSVGSLGIRGGNLNHGRGISTPPLLAPLRERGMGVTSELR